MKLFVWDFHGVMEKNNEKAVLEISNKALEFFDYKERFSEETIDILYGAKWFEYFKYILPNATNDEYMALQNKCREIGRNHPEIIQKHIKPNDSLYDILEEIKQKDHLQIVISNSSKNAINFFLNSVNVASYFPEEYRFGVDNHKLETLPAKNIALKNFLENKNFDDIVIIGDSIKDMNLKSVAGGVTYLYAHPGRKFKDCEADYYINDLRDILKEIN